MPQPATHYLVVRRSIPKKYWKEWWDVYKCYFGFGSFAPDLFYFPCFESVGLVKNIRKDISWENLADIFHSSGSYDFYCKLLDNAKSQKSMSTDANKLLAFAFGYYCHVVTDCIFHPYVYRSTGDHWNTKTDVPEYRHKLQELAIDNGISQKYYDIRKNKVNINWNCQNEAMLLDAEITSLLHNTLLEIYPDCYPLEENNIDNINHPLQQAYHALKQVMDKIFTGEKIAVFGALKIDTVKKIAEKILIPSTFSFTAPYPDCQGLYAYTPEDLYNFSCSTSRKIFNLTLAFWHAKKSISAKDFFAQNTTNYLGVGNWNLDTGLPCEFNNYKKMRKEDRYHYNFKIDKLKEIYINLESQYQPSEFKKPT